MNNAISGTTKIVGIIGHPIAHSLSPAMHNAAFRTLGLDFAYVPFPVFPENLNDAVAGLRALNIVGFNVTIPHKIAVLPLLDNIDPLAQKIGAVNTVVNNHGKLTGYNTDAEGFYRALLQYGVVPRGKNVAVLGAGGASRAIACILAKKGARLIVLNRREHLDKAQTIAALVKNHFNASVKVVALDNLAAALKGVDILVNATSVGMTPNLQRSIVPADLLSGIPVVVDIVYNPRQTRLLKDAASAGSKTIGGLDMLVWQGTLAFEMWTGKKAPVDVMKYVGEKALGVYEN